MCVWVRLCVRGRGVGLCGRWGWVYVGEGCVWGEWGLEGDVGVGKLCGGGCVGGGGGV